MVSPWKRLARWVSPQREPKEENGPTDDVKPEASIGAESIETAVDEGLDSTERLAVGLAQSDDTIEAVSEDTGDGQDAVGSAPATVDIESARIVEAIHVAAPDNADTGGRDTWKPSQASQATPRKRSRGGKRAEAVEVVPQPSPVVATKSDDAISLDKEISLLRGQLINKLQLQNAQLKRMLERFER